MTFTINDRCRVGAAERSVYNEILQMQKKKTIDEDFDTGKDFSMSSWTFVFITKMNN